MRIPPADYVDQVHRLRARYPRGRSAIMGALRLAQERHEGWLPPEALEEVAYAMDVTPAHAEAVASFYDMYNLAPIGRHIVEVCTNLSCALVGAQQVVEAFEEELGVRAGETTEDGQVTLRLVECAGGCGYAPVVILDGRYKEPTRPEDVPAALEQVRNGAGG
ncbi:MAG TPA: NADH-quinone oxidoreductase subunit NuoE [Gaiellaceae bacterium]|jgi:NADH-quinone oxidoreductase E subunit|nr:NADH-quinone oxidoreductase subunit NuoE [Gaiellaceae bacterium]